MTTDLAKKYGQTPGQNPTLLTKYATIQGIQQALPAFTAWARSLGLTDNQIVQVDSFSAEHNNEVWRTHGYWPGSGFVAGQICNSRCNIEWPDGSWSVRMPLLGALADYSGQGSTFWRDASGFTYGTQIRIDPVWIGIPGWPKRAFISVNYGAGVGGVYVEGLGIYNTCFEGSGGLSNYDPLTEAGGVLIENGGSCCMIERCRVDGWNGPGIHVIGAIPLQLNHVRAFRNARASLLLEGCALGKVNAYGLEMDDSTIGIDMIEGRNGQAAGLGSGTFDLKVENGKNTNRPMTVLKASGQVNMTITSMRASYYNGVKPATVVQWSCNSNSWLACMGYTNSGTHAASGPPALVRVGTTAYPHPANSEGVAFSVRGSSFLSNQR